MWEAIADAGRWVVGGLKTIWKVIAEFAETKFPNIFKAFKDVMETFEGFLGLKKGEIVEETAEDVVKGENKIADATSEVKHEHVEETKVPDKTPVTPKSDLVSRIKAKLGLYPKVVDQRTGRYIKFPSEIQVRVEKSLRVVWDKTERSKFIREWIERGYPTPAVGWDKYDIHHINPREFGGTNEFWNLVPVERNTHKLFNAFWREFIEL